MKTMPLIAVAIGLCSTPALSAQFFYKPGDRIAFSYKYLERKCEKGGECLPVGINPATLVLETTIGDIKAPNTDHASLVTIEGSCVTRELTAVYDTAIGVSTTCTGPSGRRTATANCAIGRLKSLSGGEFLVDKVGRALEEDEPPYSVIEQKGGALSDGTLYRVVVEQFKALCPAKVMSWK